MDNESPVTPTTKLEVTKDYGIFKELNGNRVIDEFHVTKLIKSFESNGNLTGNFPIIVNEHMEVIDGQHRLEALKRLNWSVYYRVEEGLNLSTTHAINSVARIWSWKDYATSFAKQGKFDYQVILDWAEEFKVGWHILKTFAGLREDRGFTKYRNGEIILPHRNRSHALLVRYKEISDELALGDSHFAQAVYKLLLNPDYDHTHMLHKIALEQRPEVRRQGTVLDYVRALEGLYNYKVAEENRVRFY